MSDQTPPRAADGPDNGDDASHGANPRRSDNGLRDASRGPNTGTPKFRTVRTPIRAAHDLNPALVPTAAVEWMTARNIATIMSTLDHRHGIRHYTPAPLEPPAPMPTGWDTATTYADTTRPGRLVRVIALMAWGPSGCRLWELAPQLTDSADTTDLDTRATVAGSIALAADPLRIPGVEAVTSWKGDYDGLTSFVFLARELTAHEFATVVGYNLPLIGACDLMEVLDRAPQYTPVTAPWKE